MSGVQRNGGGSAQKKKNRRDMASSHNNTNNATTDGALCRCCGPPSSPNWKEPDRDIDIHHVVAPAAPAATTRSKTSPATTRSKTLMRRVSDVNDKAAKFITNFYSQLKGNSDAPSAQLSKSQSSASQLPSSSSTS